MNHYHFDQLGSTRLLTNSAGAVTDEYSYDAYGAVLSHNRSTGSVDQPYQYVGQLGYYTHYQEPGFGLMQLGVRFYKASRGLMIQADALASDDASVYVYSNGKPTLMVDPSGLKCHRVNPTHCGNYIGKCVNKARKCLPFAGGPLSDWALRREKVEFYVCDGTNPDANGDTQYILNPWHWGLRVRIWPGNSDTDCGTVLHEIFHVYWWGDWPSGKHRAENDPFHNKINNVAHNAWDYYCGSMCGRRPPKDLYDDFSDVMNIPRIRPAK